MTTITEFRNSKQRITRRHNPDVFEDYDLQSSKCWVYGPHDASYEWGYIEILMPYYILNDTLKELTIYMLTLGCDQWMSNDLADLEEKLFEWQKDNSVFEPTPSDMRQRLLGVCGNAIDLFWEHIAESYPECKTGNLGPTATMDFEQSVYKAVTTWRDTNGGGQKGMSNFGKGKVIFVVMTSSQDRYAKLSCVGAFNGLSPALDYARSLMDDECRERGIDHKMVEEDGGQYTMVLSHEDTDYKVIIDYCADRTGEE